MTTSALKSSRLTMSVVAVAVLLTACNATQKHTTIGAGVGAVAGAAIGGNTKSAAIGAGVGALGGYIWSRHMQEKKAAMEKATAGTGVGVTQTQDNQLKVNVPADFSFDVGRADIKPSMQPILNQFAQGLSGQPNTEVRIFGHTDNTGSDAINDPLSHNRALSVYNYLASRGVDGRRMTIAGRGEREPVADNSTEYGRARNRRVEIFLAERATTAAR